MNIGGRLVHFPGMGDAAHARPNWLLHIRWVKQAYQQTGVISLLS